MYTNLATERLRIRPIHLKDAEFIFELVNSEGWLKFIGDRNVSNTRDAENYIQEILNNDSYYYNVFELKESRKAIGVVTFLKREEEMFPDIGFALLPKFEKKGYTLEASKCYLERVKELGKHENIIAITLPKNKRSINLLQKLGLRYQGDFQKGENLLSYYSLKSLGKENKNISNKKDKS
ncbi:GNAT family N-acetyltransferase [Flagellimonas meridianipacifica]|uniref:RimJ/RimL family protein N-acetyltransferase n=1 Tax=Flagellimonas meridianipacifica TaxID=1080225 RepID=A0A2T0M9R9_9FLAO|nr:GNAT family N-acetyltransferase [Allomuricauda pacifica]PRX54172.1 RimJ/RimL family protein N-acetyltransferase [Allomuricauda pacifica]